MNPACGAKPGTVKEVVLRYVAWTLRNIVPKYAAISIAVSALERLLGSWVVKVRVTFSTSSLASIDALVVDIGLIFTLTTLPLSVTALTLSVSLPNRWLTSMTSPATRETVSV